MFPFSEKSTTLRFSLKLLCCGFFLFLFNSSALKAESKWTPSGDVSKNWFVYSPAWKTYLPYISSKHFSYQSKSLIFNKNQPHSSFLQIEPDKNYHLFINGVYQYQFKPNQLYRLKIDSLLSKTQQNYVVFTLYHKELKGLPEKISQVNLVNINIKQQQNLFNVMARPATILDNFFFVGSLFVLFLFAWIYRYFPRNFAFFFRFSDWLSFTYKEDPVVKTVFSFANLLILFGVSLLIAFVGFYQTYFDPIELEQLKSGNNELMVSTVFGFLIKNAIIAFLLFLSRYIGYLIFTSLFKMEILATPHFLKSVQTNVQFYCLLYLGLFLLNLLGSSQFTPTLGQISWLINTFLLVRMIYFFVLFKRTFHFNSLTLAVYLIFLEGQAILFGIRQIIFPDNLW